MILAIPGGRELASRARQAGRALLEFRIAVEAIRRIPTGTISA
jgi:hypothetical protein